MEAKNIKGSPLVKKVVGCAYLRGGESVAFLSSFLSHLELMPLFQRAISECGARKRLSITPARSGLPAAATGWAARSCGQYFRRHRPTGLVGFRLPQHFCSQRPERNAEASVWRVFVAYGSRLIWSRISGCTAVNVMCEAPEFDTFRHLPSHRDPFSPEPRQTPGVIHMSSLL